MKHLNPLGAVKMRELSRVLADRFQDAKTAINSKYRVDAFLEAHGIHVDSNKQIRCPFHDDSTPSFSVNTKQNIWKCFGCPDGGHFVDLWIKYENKFNSKKYSIYTGIETILSRDSELQHTLGFSTIFQSDDVATDLFDEVKKNAETTGFFDFDSVLCKVTKPEHIATDSMLDVLKALKYAQPDEIIRFISDCELGMTEQQLISKYYKHQDDVDTFITEFAVRNASSDVISELKGILSDD